MTPRKSSRPLRVFLCTLGCSKNEVDSQRFASLFAQGGAELVASPEEADWGLVNTCGFIVPAIEESLQAIFDLEDLKKKGSLSSIGVMGCLYNRFGEELRKELPEVDFWIPCEGWKELRHFLHLEEKDSLPSRRLVSSRSPWVRYLKIVEGCNNHCTYCTIPSIRGPLRSLPREVLAEEARMLVEEGAREICIIGQDITRYGEDFASSKDSLIGLLRHLGEVLPEDVWLRLLYLHPWGITENFWKELFEIPQVIPYADVPVQHGDEGVLARMNRKDSRKRLEGIFQAARKIRPSMVFRSTVMVGFPGEDEDAFRELLDFLRQVRFQRLGCFIYSPEEGTPAASFPHQVDSEVARERLEEVMALQEEISLEHQESLLGKELEVMVEQQEGNILLGRSYREAPEVDGQIEMDLPEKKVSPGSRVRVKILEALEHDLRGKIL